MSTCIRCGRTIKNPLSVQHGMGPVCFKREIFAMSKRKFDERQMDLFSSEGFRISDLAMRIQHLKDRIERRLK